MNARPERLWHEGRERRVGLLAPVAERSEHHMVRQRCSRVDTAGTKARDVRPSPASRCLELVEEQPGRKISVDVVKQAAALTGVVASADGFGATDAHADAPGPDDEAELLPLGRLLIKIYGEQPQELSLDQGKIIVGRDRLCEICVNGLRVSRFHALFSLDNDGLVVADLGSTNGTRVNGKKIDRYTLADGDVITIGMARITYEAGCELVAPSVAGSMSANELEDTVEGESPINYLGNSLKVLGRS